MTSPSVQLFDDLADPLTRAVGRFITDRYLATYFFSEAVASRAFDDAATCALWNAGDRDNLAMRTFGGDSYLVTLDHHRVTPVTLNPDGTIEPKQP